MQASPRIFALFIVLMFSAGMTAGFIQEIIFHEKINESGNQIIFRSSIPDTAVIAHLGPFSKICYRGTWRIYGEKNYLSETGSRGINSKSGNLTCYNGPLNFQSVRHFITSETEEPALSLYRNVSFSGAEILVTADELGEVEMPVETCVYSAVASWTLFEGQFFTGNSACLSPRTDDRYLYGYYISDYNIKKVGSVLKTCDPAIIREARQKYSSLA